MNEKINPNDFKTFEKSEKLAVIATIGADRDPHISLITTLMAKDENTMVAGQFSQGLSKVNMIERHKSGFAILTLDMNLWTGFCDWYDVKTEGEEYVKYNNMQMWRFNTYFGIGKVHYAHLKGITEKKKLNLLGVGVNAVRVLMLKGLMKNKNGKDIISPFATKLFNALGNPKFVSFINEEGYPAVVPAVQAQAVGRDRIVFTASPYKSLFGGLKKGARVAVMAISLKMESVLVKGTFSGFKNGIGYIDIDRVYNSMPPICGYTYPKEEYKEVTEF